MGPVVAQGCGHVEHADDPTAVGRLYACMS